jgi:UDP-MurNAc hydroxylase
MKITKYGSATVLIETGGVSILCDPWLTDGAYFGSWCNFPPINLDECDFSNVDFVYISHIHPDHFDPKTMALVNKKALVLIHRYHQKFLKASIERLGFNVIELENGKPFDMLGKLNISIFAADDCDPSICGNLFGCITTEIKGSMQLDSLCVIDDGQHIVVNTNDCPYGIAKNTLKRIKKNFPTIDFALVGYTSASLYPHSMIDYSNDEKIAGVEHAKLKGLMSGLNSLKELKPKYYMPFAGTYIIGGANYNKNKFLPIPEIQDAVKFFQSDILLKESGGVPVLLNFKESFELNTKKVSAPYVPINQKERQLYTQNIASQFEYSFENTCFPNELEIISLFKRAIKRLRNKQKELSFFEDVNLVFDVNDNLFVCINLVNTEAELITELERLKNYHRFKLDTRLLKWVLLGPRYANWNNIEIGALLDFSRKPDIYRMDVHTLINSLHV